MTTQPPIAEHFASLASRYDLALCDVWGVVHNGVVAHADACDALHRFRAAGGTVVLLTNAPRQNSAVIGFLDQLKVPRDAYDLVVSSGDVARSEIEARRDQAVLHIGPSRDHSMFAEPGIRFAPVEEADYAVCSGLFDDETEAPEDYRDLLAAMRRRGLLMICANPDHVVERGNRLVYCAGAIADLYDTMGGKVLYAGKPHRPIYDLALSRATALRGGGIARERVLAIGDSVRTDLTGAARFGVDCLFVADGIHAGEIGGPEGLDEAALASMFGEAGVFPAAVTCRLAW